MIPSGLFTRGPVCSLCTRVWLQCFHVPYSALTMFITRDQKERDSATAYRTSALRFGLLLFARVFAAPALTLCLWCCPGMMVEVLGTVLATAIQGQIVGGASNCPTEPDVINGWNSTVTNSSIVTLDETVSLSIFAFF